MRQIHHGDAVSIVCQ